MSCPICGATCVCRKRGEDGRCCACHKHKARTLQQAQAHAQYDVEHQRPKDAASVYPIDELLTELGARRVDRRDGFSYAGLFDRPVVTDIVIVRDGPMPVVIATERSDNPGASITNTIEKLAAKLMSETGWLLGDFVLVEHYPAHRYGGNLGRSLSQVHFERMWSGVTWTHLDIEGLRALLSPPCTCTWENGSWDVCAQHRTPHSQHTTPAPGCLSCETLLDEAREIQSEAPWNS